jgi:hypothetical protein
MANIVIDLYRKEFGDTWLNEYKKNDTCVKLLTFKEGFGIPTPTKFENFPGNSSDSFTVTLDKNWFDPMIQTIQFTEEFIPDPSTLKPNDDVLEDKWFDDFKQALEFPEFDF